MTDNFPVKNELPAFCIVFRPFMQQTPVRYPGCKNRLEGLSLSRYSANG